MLQCWQLSVETPIFQFRTFLFDLFRRPKQVREHFFGANNFSFLDRRQDRKFFLRNLRGSKTRKTQEKIKFCRIEKNCKQKISDLPWLGGSVCRANEKTVTLCKAAAKFLIRCTPRKNLHYVNTMLDGSKLISVEKCLISLIKTIFKQ